MGALLKAYGRLFVRSWCPDYGGTLKGVSPRRWLVMALFWPLFVLLQAIQGVVFTSGVSQGAGHHLGSSVMAVETRLGHHDAERLVHEPTRGGPPIKPSVLIGPFIPGGELDWPWWGEKEPVIRCVSRASNKGGLG